LAAIARDRATPKDRSSSGECSRRGIEARRNGHAHVHLGLLGQDHPELLVGEVDRDLLERPHRVHPEQQRRAVVEIELLERVRVGEDDRQVLEGHAAELELVEHHIFPHQRLAGDGAELDRARVAEPAAEELPAQGPIPDGELGAGIEHRRHRAIVRSRPGDDEAAVAARGADDDRARLVEHVPRPRGHDRHRLPFEIEEDSLRAKRIHAENPVRTHIGAVEQRCIRHFHRSARHLQARHGRRRDGRHSAERVKRGVVASLQIQLPREVAGNGGAVGSRVDEEAIRARPGHADRNGHPVVAVVAELDVLGLRGPVDLDAVADRFEAGGARLGVQRRSGGQHRKRKNQQASHHGISSVIELTRRARPVQTPCDESANGNLLVSLSC
jgi:hypothetical protein